MRCFLVIIALCCGSAWCEFVRGQDQEPLPDPAVESAEMPLPALGGKNRLAAAAIQRELERETQLDVKDVPLDQVLRELAREHQLPIRLDPIGLKLAGVSSDELIDVELRNISLHGVLKTLLHPLGLTFIVRDEMLLVTSLDCPEKSATVRTFHLGNLLQQVDYPSELLNVLEMAWPDSDRIDRETQCRPRATLVGGSLCVRGSPRHHELVEELIGDLIANLPPPVKKTPPSGDLRERPSTPEVPADRVPPVKRPEKPQEKPPESSERFH